MTDNNNKLRAVLLAALMVLWVFAGTMAFAGSAAAQSTPANVLNGGTPDNVPVENDAVQNVDEIEVDADGSTFSEDTVKVYVDVSDLATESGVSLDSAQTANRQIEVDTGSGYTSISAQDEETAFSNDVFELTFQDSEISNAEQIRVSFDIVQIDARDGDTASSGLQYDVGATVGSDSDSSVLGTSTSALSSSFALESQASYPTPSTDATFASGQLRYQGQTLRILSDSDAGTPDENPRQQNYILRNYDSTAANPAGAAVQELTWTRTGDNQYTSRIRTGSLEGEYVVTRGGSGVRSAVYTDSNGVIQGYADSTANTRDFTRATNADEAIADNPQVDITVQDLDVAFDLDDDETVRVGESADLDFTSIRNDYSVNVSEDSLDSEELATLFANADVESTTEFSDDDVLRLEGINSEDTLTVDFNEDAIEEGDYDFQFNVVDTSASDNASITLANELDADVNFDQAQFNQNRGDIARINLTTEGTFEADEFDIVIGDQDDVGYQANVTVSPNSTGHVSLLFNTYAAGQAGDRTDTSVSGTDPVFVADVGDVEAVSENTSDGNALDKRLDAELYDIIAQESSSNIGNLNADAEEYDVSVLNLAERSTDGLTIHTAPSNDLSDFDNPDTIYAGIEAGNVTESETIAITDQDRTTSNRRGDVIIHQLEANGIFGALPTYSSESAFIQALVEQNSGAFNLTFEQQNPDSNRAPYELDTSATDLDSAFTVVPDDENNTVFIVVDSNQLRFERASGSQGSRARVDDEFEVKFNVSESYLQDFTRDDVDDPESVNDTFEFVDREASFDTVNETVRVQPSADAQISGDTTVAPGTTVNVRARATGESPFLKTNETTVASDGSFETIAGGLDFSEVSPGQNFTATIRSQGFEDNAETDGLVIEGDISEVEITNQTTDGTTATVDRVYLPDGGFVTIHDGTLLDGNTLDSVRGTSEYLESGEHTDVEVTLDTPYEADGTVIAMPHQDTNDNEEYDFVTSEGSDDGPYTNAEGEIVLDSATLTVDTSTPTPTATATATPEPTATPTDEPTETATATASEDQPGFGAVIALIALLGAALLAARRNAF